MGRLTKSQIVEAAFWLILVVFFFAYSFEFKHRKPSTTASAGI